MEFTKQFKAARRVSTPLLCVRTFDAKSTVDGIKATLNGALDSTAILTWDAINGLSPANNTDKTIETYTSIVGSDGQGATIPLPECLRMCHTDEIGDTIIFISNAHMHWKLDPATVQGIWNLRETYKANGNMLVLLTMPGAVLPPELTSDVLVLDEPLPTVSQLQQTVRDTFKFGGVPEGTLTDETIKQATDALIGLPAFPAEQATAMCLELKHDTKKKEVIGGSINIHDLWDRKRQIINQAPGLSVYTGKETLDDIGGVEQAKEFFRAVMEGKNAPQVIIFIDEIEKALAGMGTDTSGTKTEMAGSMLSWMQDRKIRGGMFIGIPGVSKSALCKALGGSYGKPVINFNIAGMQDMHVGNSGGNLRAAQKVVDAIAGEEPGRVLALATCNGIAALPPELRRRFSLAQFFFDAPSEEEKEIIWNIHRTKNGIPAGEPNPKAAGWTGAEIESCCEKANMLNWTLAKAAGYIVPVTTSAADLIKKTRLEASGKYLSASKPGTYDYRETEPVKNIQGPVVEGRKIRE